jgi:two-component system phosphate regulon sensor histidine kinase PhoR
MLYDYTQLHNLENVQKEFVANVSHELKTPITTIQGFVETLQRGALDNPENARQFLSIIGKNTTRLNQIIDDLLLLSRVEEHNELSRMTTDAASIKDILDSAIKNCSPKARESEFEITCHCPENLNTKGNPSLLEHAITNLIDNAIKYSYPNKKVEIFAEAHGPKLFIHVKDWGQGIPAKDQERLFERFYRIDKNHSRNLGGTGLGLSITRQIAHIHGGQVQVQSELGKGSVFTIELPQAG